MSGSRRWDDAGDTFIAPGWANRYLERRQSSSILSRFGVAVARSFWWRDRAACAGVDTEEFFPETHRGYGGSMPLEMKRMCRDCPVLHECFLDAVQNGDHGYRAGTSKHQRDEWQKLNREDLANGGPGMSLPTPDQKKPHWTMWWDVKQHPPVLVKGQCWCYVTYDHWKVGNLREGQWVPDEARWPRVRGAA